jgi:hypothetical protein
MECQLAHREQRLVAYESSAAWFSGISSDMRSAAPRAAVVLPGHPDRPACSIDRIGELGPDTTVRILLSADPYLLAVPRDRLAVLRYEAAFVCRFPERLACA